MDTRKVISLSKMKVKYGGIISSKGIIFGTFNPYLCSFYVPFYSITDISKIRVIGGHSPGKVI